MAQQITEVDIENPTKEGWLQKESRHFRRWRCRWIVLDGSKLYSFKTEKKYENPTEVIDLKVFSSVKSSEDQTHKQHSFDVYSPKMRFSMIAQTENEKEDWIRHIGKAIVMSNQNDLAMMGNQASTQSPGIDAGADTTKEKKGAVWDRSSTMVSSYGDTDPIEAFKNTIKEQCEEGTLPPFRKTKIYQIYEWSKDYFDHKSIVVGCNDSGNDYGFITMELFVDKKEEKIFPGCKFIDQKEGIINIKSQRWKLILSKLETKLSNLVDLSLDLVNNHGKYSGGYNDCQTFVNGFKAACGKPNEKISIARVAGYSTLNHVKGSLAKNPVHGNVVPILIGVAGMLDYCVRPIAISLNKNDYGKVHLKDSKNISTPMFTSFLKARQRYDNANGKYNNEISDWLNEMKRDFEKNDKKTDENNENSSIKSIQFIGYTTEEINKENEDKNGNSSFQSIAKCCSENIDFENGLYWIKVETTENNDKMDNKDDSDESIWVIPRKYDHLAAMSSFLQGKLKIEIEKCALPPNMSSMDEAPLSQNLLNMTFHFQELLFAVLKDKGVPYCLLANFLTKSKISQADMKYCIEMSPQEKDSARIVASFFH